MYPTLEKVKEIAASGEYRRIPVCKELYADRYTPVEVMRVCGKQVSIVICSRVPVRRRCGEDFLFSVMSRRWRSPVRMES